MPVPSSGYSVLLFTPDTDLQALFRHVFSDASVAVVRDRGTFEKELKRPVDAVVVEVRDGQDSGAALPAHFDASRTLLISGSKTVLKRTARLLQAPGAQAVNGKLRDASLESYLEIKMGEFVKGMRNGSARNLHPMLISAVERPLIASALRETKGNQLQAAELLGLNRNTLRKKIAELHIPLKRTKRKTTRA